MLKTVSRHLTGIEAHIIRTRLEAEDIPAFLSSEHYIGLDWSLALALGYIQVRVPAGYFEAAEQVIENIERGVYEAELVEELGAEVMASPCCPGCGGDEVFPVQWPAKLSLLFVFLIATVPLPYSQHLKRCGSCNRYWIDREERGYPLHVPALYIFVWALIFTAIILPFSPPFEFYADHNDGFIPVYAEETFENLDGVNNTDTMEIIYSD